MTDPNPYDPPQTPTLKPAQVAKRSIGLVVIVLLTPVAVSITLAASCAVWAQVTDHFLPSATDMALLGLPPLIVLIAMVWWTFRIYRRQKTRVAKASNDR